MSEGSQIFEFGGFRVNTAEETLCRNGENLPINRRTFEVLRLLIERSGQIVTRQEFFDTVWADTFVEDNSLTVAVTSIRKLLGDDPKKPKFIENLPRKGYRFIGDVKIVDDTPAIIETQETPVPDPAEQTESNPIFKDRKVLIIVAAACLLFVLTALGFNYLGLGGPVDAGQIDSIAVLPFENLDTETQYLSDGLTDSVINSLAELPNLRVISRSSVFQYKGKATDLQAIGSALRVRALVTGRIVQRGDDLIINAEVVDLRENRQIWGRQFTGKLTSASGLPAEISREIAVALLTSLTADQRSRLARQRTDSPEAFQLYLKGRHNWNKRTDEGFEKAEGFYRQAIDIDPTFGVAYAGLANVYAIGQFKFIKTNGDRVTIVRGAVNRALEIDPGLSEAHAAKGLAESFFGWNWDVAEQDYKLAIELNPNNATAHHLYAELLAIKGRFEESFAEYDKAIQIDPLSMAIKSDLGITYFYAGQNDRAIEYLQKLKEEDPNYPRTSFNLFQAYQQAGMLEEAIQEYEQAAKYTGDDPEKAGKRMADLHEALRTGGSEAYWRKVSEPVSEGLVGYNPFNVAQVAAHLGERDKAFEYLEKTYQGGGGNMAYLIARPEFRTLRYDPRFTDLLRRVGLQH